MRSRTYSTWSESGDYVADLLRGVSFRVDGHIEILRSKVRSRSGFALEVFAIEDHPSCPLLMPPTAMFCELRIKYESISRATRRSIRSRSGQIQPLRRQRGRPKAEAITQGPAPANIGADDRKIISAARKQHLSLLPLLNMAT